MRPVRLPRQLLLVSAAIALVVPFLARLPGAYLRGWDWLGDYLPGIGGVLFFSAFSLMPAGALFVFGKLSTRAPVAYWFAVAGLIAHLLWAHGALNLRASSTAGLALIFVPPYAIGAAGLGWMIGWLVQSVTDDERGRAWAAAAAVVVATAWGLTTSVRESASVAEREARFPVVAVREVSLVKREVYGCCPIGRIEAMALDEFDSQAGADIGVLGESAVAVLDPATHAVKSQTPFAAQGCSHCVGMYPYLVPDGKGGHLVATSDGVSDRHGRLLWENNATGFTRTTPIRVSQGAWAFLVYDSHERIDLHDVSGKVLWSVGLPVTSSGVYVDAAGRDLPSAITGYGSSRHVHLFDAEGKAEKFIRIPEWALNVQAISWPAPGHLLVGGGSWIGVLDADGREVLRHVIQGTSFDPYHGPDGTAVRFYAADGPYLAVASHGSSGYARSVLLVFDPTGRLVWQEELKKLTSLLAVPSVTGDADVLLAGGIAGILEYRAAAPSQPNHAPDHETR
jgi:hypothetical protein